MSAAIPRNLVIAALSLTLLPSSGCGRAVRRSTQSSSPIGTTSSLIGMWKPTDRATDFVLQLRPGGRFEYKVAGFPADGTWVEKGAVLEMYEETVLGQDAREYTRQSGPSKGTISPDRKRITLPLSPKKIVVLEKADR